MKNQSFSVWHEHQPTPHEFSSKISQLLRRKLTQKLQSETAAPPHTTGMTAMQYGQKCNACRELQVVTDNDSKLPRTLGPRSKRLLEFRISGRTRHSRNVATSHKPWPTLCVRTTEMRFILCKSC